MKKATTIIFPDIHGNNFWKELAENHPDEDMIFLGDYNDPYSRSGISAEDSLENFNSIIDFASSHRDNVTLLLGNHDIAYIDNRLFPSRYDFGNADMIRSIISNNGDLFNLAAERTVGRTCYIFSHAGIGKGWMEESGASSIFPTMFDEDGHLTSLDTTLVNNAWHDLEQQARMLDILTHVSKIRGGKSKSGSMIWADMSEIERDDNLLPGYFQIFGHTRQKTGPVITTKFANLDCQRPFILTENGLSDFYS